MVSDPPDSILAQRLRTARLAAKLTQQELAGETFSKSYISAVEQGRMIPSLPSLSVLATRLGVAMSYLLGESDLELSAAAERPQEPPQPSPPHPPTQQAQVQQLLAQAEEHIRRRELTQALEVLRNSDQPLINRLLRHHPRWYALVGWALLRQQQLEEARAVLEQGLQLVEKQRQVPGAKGQYLQEQAEWLRYYLGLSHCMADQHVQALYHHQQGLNAIRDGIIQDHELMMLTYKGAGNAALALGYYHEAVVYFTMAKKHGLDVHDPRGEGLILWGLGIAHKFLRNVSEARDAFVQASQIFEQSGDKTLVAQLRSMLANLLIQFQHYDEAEQILRQALGTAQRDGDEHTRGLVLANMAALHLANGKLERAVRSAQDGLDVLQGKENYYHTTGQLYVTLARAYELQQDLAAAEQALQTAIEHFSKTQHEGLLRQAQIRYGEFLAERGGYQQAYEQMAHIPSHKISVE
jgi:transcriptional regulator with XRE-family HTH domain/predicted negative regulator of RcsB-dependent stress response